MCSFEMEIGFEMKSTLYEDGGSKLLWHISNKLPVDKASPQ